MLSLILSNHREKILRNPGLSQSSWHLQGKPARHTKLVSFRASEYSWWAGQPRSQHLRSLRGTSAMRYGYTKRHMAVSCSFSCDFLICIESGPLEAISQLSFKLKFGETCLG